MGMFSSGITGFELVYSTVLDKFGTSVASKVAEPGLDTAKLLTGCPGEAAADLPTYQSCL